MGVIRRRDARGMGLGWCSVDPSHVPQASYSGLSFETTSCSAETIVLKKSTGWSKRDVFLDEFEGAGLPVPLAQSRSFGTPSSAKSGFG